MYIITSKTNIEYDFKSIDVEETNNIITSLKNKSSFGYDLIFTKLVKHLKHVTVEH